MCPPILLVSVKPSHGGVPPVDGLLMLDAVDAALAVQLRLVVRLPEAPVGAIILVKLVERSVLAATRAEALLLGHL